MFKPEHGPEPEPASGPPVPVPDRDLRLSLWLRVREFAVPPSMIETATARRHHGDWAGACAAAGIDVDLRLRDVARSHGSGLAARIRADLRHLAPDLLRWHMPRVAPDGLLRPGTTVTLARYDAGESGTAPAAPPVHLVVRTPPAWADGGQRMSLALWDGSRQARGPDAATVAARGHPHPRPSRRFRFDLHRHLWDARRTDEFRARSGAVGTAADGTGAGVPSDFGPQAGGCAVDRWADEAAILLRAEGRCGGPVVVRPGGRSRLVLYGDGNGAGNGAGDGDGVHAHASRARSITAAPGAPVRGGLSALPVLPDAATWVPPDLELLRAGLLGAGRLHPLVASALVPEHGLQQTPSAGGDRPTTWTPAARGAPGEPHPVDCRGARHRIGLVDGVLVALDHTPDEVRREELLAALGGTPLPCLQAIDEAHRHPDCLTGVRERLDHGDTAGALAVVEGLLGPAAVLRDGALRDALEAAARRRLDYGLFRAGLAGPGRCPPGAGPGQHPGPQHRRALNRRTRPRLALQT